MADERITQHVLEGASSILSAKFVRWKLFFHFQSQRVKLS